MRSRPAQHDDADLVRRCLAGDEGAWAELVGRYERLVYSIALRCGLGRDDADDVFQVVFTTLFRRLAGLRDQERLSSWLITTAYRESWRVARGRGRAAEELDEALPDDSTPPADLVADADRDQRVREALARLDARCRELLTALFLDEGEPAYATIGTRLGMAVGSIGPTRARCFKKLEVLLAEVGLP
jgi:RNA polymerase sigma factor (sigma-70 family)